MGVQGSKELIPPSPQEGSEHLFNVNSLFYSTQIGYVLAICSNCILKCHVPGLKDLQFNNLPLLS